LVSTISRTFLALAWFTFLHKQVITLFNIQKANHASKTSQRENISFVALFSRSTITNMTERQIMWGLCRYLEILEKYFIFSRMRLLSYRPVSIKSIPTVIVVVAVKTVGKSHCKSPSYSCRSRHQSGHHRRCSRHPLHCCL
jgi:hypothetical protein